MDDVTLFQSISSTADPGSVEDQGLKFIHSGSDPKEETEKKKKKHREKHG